MDFRLLRHNKHHVLYIIIAQQTTVLAERESQNTDQMQIGSKLFDVNRFTWSCHNIKRK